MCTEKSISIVFWCRIMNFFESIESFYESSYQKRLIVNLPIAFIVSFTLLFYMPFESMSSNKASLDFKVSDAVLPLVLLSVIVMVLLTLLLSIFKGRAYKIIITVLIAFTFMCHIQAMYLNIDVGLLTGDDINWALYTKDMILNSIIWVVVLAAFILIFVFLKKYWKIFICLVLAVLFIAQSVGVVSIAAFQKNGIAGENYIGETDDYFLSNKDISTFSSKNNTLVFVLDRMDYTYFEEALKKDKSLENSLKDFTSFSNATASYFRTIPGANYILTNYTKDAYKKPLNDFLVESFSDGDKHILDDFNKKGYSVDIYEPKNIILGRGEPFAGKISNLSCDKRYFNYFNLLSNLEKISLFRCVPIALKPLFEFNTDELNEDIYSDIVKETDSEYTIDDLTFKGKTTGIELDDKSRFKFFHLEGSHAPYILNENGDRAEGETDAVTQTIGSLKIVLNIIEQLKRYSLYDKSSIIITADHGKIDFDSADIEKPVKITLLYKAAAQRHNSLVTSDVPVSHDNIPATLLKDSGIDYLKYGIPLDEAGDSKTYKNRYAYKTIMDLQSCKENTLITYLIGENADDWTQWKKISSEEIQYTYN